MKVSDALDANFIYAGDLDGKEVMLTIDRVSPAGTVKRADGRLIDKPTVYFKETGRGLVMCKTNMRRVQLAHGNEMDRWPGKKIAIYPTTTEIATSAAEQAGCAILATKGRMSTVPCIRVKVPAGLYEPPAIQKEEKEIEW